MRRNAFNTVCSIAMGLLVFLFCFPLILIIAASFMGDAELARHLAGILNRSGEYASLPVVPQYPTLEGYVRLLIDTPEFYPLFWNSVVIVVAVIAGQALIALPAAWAFARYDFPAKRPVFMLYIVLMLMPFQVLMLPEYIVLDSLGLLNTLLAIIVPGAFSTFPVFIMYHFFKTIPEGLLDSARLDGAGEMQVFLRIGLPLAKPGILAILLLGFLEYWNLVEQPLLFLEDKTTWPLSLFLPSMGFEQGGIVFVAAVITLIPSLLVFFAGRSYLEQGISTMASKG